MFTNRHQNIKCLLTIYGLFTLLVCLIVLYLGTEPSHPAAVILKNYPVPKRNALFNITNFSYVLDSGGCSKNVFAVLIVTCYAGDVEIRSAVRQAYPRKLLDKLNLKRVFLLAKIHEKRNVNHVEQTAIENEQKRFGDIVQGSFIEDYRNLTYKHVMGLRWAYETCSKVPYIIKMDSDIVVDLYSLVKMLHKLPKRNIVLAGYNMINMKPIRDPLNKWFVSSQEYYRDWYPDFLSGWLYITNPLTASMLLEKAKAVPYFWIDDTYVTGILREQLNISIAKLNKYYTTHPEHLQCCIKQPKYECDFWIGPNGGNNKFIINFEKYAEGCQKSQCRKRTRKTTVRNNCVVKWTNDRFGKETI